MEFNLFFFLKKKENTTIIFILKYNRLENNIRVQYYIRTYIIISYVFFIEIL